MKENFLLLTWHSIFNKQLTIIIFWKKILSASCFHIDENLIKDYLYVLSIWTQVLNGETDIE